ncbi:hypothetical protein JXB41_04100 [Candidatus Woesearchaeota archaeon]|nr:hypothetical protein [Candidatus Woesearchaeota archaeon]
MEKEELYSLLLELSSLNKENADFLRLKLENKPEDALEYFKKKLKSILWNERINLREARKAITDFKRISKQPEHLLELMVFYVETGVRIGEEYGDMYEAFYSSMESMFEQIIKNLNDNTDLIPLFKDRLISIVERSCEGWGHKETMEEVMEGLGE